LSALPLFGNTPLSSLGQPKSKEPPPFDADLFRRDVQCFSFDSEFLYWRLQEGALEYALSMTNSGWGPSECYAQGNYQNGTFNGDPGFRVAFRFFRAPHFWDFVTQYTRLTARGTNQSDKPSTSGNYLTGTWPQIFTNPMEHAKSYIHLNYNLGDALISRVFFPNPHLRLRLQGGGVVSWMDQFWKILYQDGGSFETKIENRWRFIGGGLRIGVLFDWYWFMNIYMTGGSTFAALLGSYHNQAKQTTNFQPSGLFNPSLPVRNAHFEDIRPAFEGQFYLGPSYQKNFTNQRFELFVGYELTTWWNVQEIFRSTNGAPSEAKETWINTSLLALQGLTARATLDF
jgi:hypothetical protein